MCHGNISDNEKLSPGRKVFLRLDTEYEIIIGKLNRMDKKSDTFCFPKYD